MIDHSGAIDYVLYDENYNRIVDRYITNNESVAATANFGSVAMISAEYDFTSALQPYFGLMASASKVWFKFDLEFYEYMDPSPLDNSMTLYTNYDMGDGFTQYSILSSGVTNGSNTFDTSPFDLGSQFQYATSFNYLTILQRINLYTKSDLLYDYQFIPRSFSLVVYLQGVSGSDANMFLVVDGGFKDIEKSIDELKQEVTVMQGQLDNIDDSINQGFEDVNKKQDTIIDKITSGFANIGNQVKKAVTDAVTELFVPSEEDMVAQYDKWDILMADRFGAVYESSQIIDSFVDAIQVSDTQETIEFPVVSLDIVGTTFEFGGWEVDIIPDGFQWLVDILKSITNIGCTVLFVNGMRSRYESVVK